MLDPGLLRLLAGALALTAEVGVLVLVGAGVGHWLDGNFGTGPLLLSALALLGLTAGMVRLHAGLRRLQADQDEPPPPASEP
jgi:F0F1-type ATP synthase assembly protein I